MGYEKPLTGAERVARRRAALRAQGLKPKTIWVPDVKSTDFRERAERSCQWLWDRVPEEEAVMTWIDEMNAEVFADLDQREDEVRRGQAG
jgi:DNA-binding LacI/PurR family transcriptional regulator